MAAENDSSAMSLPDFDATSLETQDVVQIPMKDYRRMVACIQNSKRSDAQYKNLNSVIEDLKQDLSRYKEKAANFERAYRDSARECGLLIQNAFRNRTSDSVTIESINQSLAEMPSFSLSTDKLFSQLVTENNDLKRKLDESLKGHGTDFKSFQSAESYEKQIQQLQGSLQQQKAKCEELSLIIEQKSAEDAITQLQAKCAHLQKQVWRLKENSTTKQALIGSFKIELERVTTLNATLTKELDQAKINMAENNEQYEKQLKTWQDEKERLESQLKKSSDRMKKILTVKETAESRTLPNQEQVYKIESLTKQIDELEKSKEVDRQKHKDEIDRLNRQNLILKQETDGLNCQILQFKQENHLLQESLQDESQKHQREREMRKELQTHWEPLVKMLPELEQRNQMGYDMACAGPSEPMPVKSTSFSNNPGILVADSPHTSSNVRAKEVSHKKPAKKEAKKSSQKDFECKRCWEPFASQKDLASHQKKCKD